MVDFGKWKIEKTLTAGGQGDILLVSHDGQQAVLKRLRNAANPERIARFKREIEVGQRLDHPNVATVIEYDIQAAKPYFISKYCPLGSLADMDLSEWSIPRKLDLFHKICQGVAHAHIEKVIHRDLKPDNILLGDSSTPIVADF